MVWEKHGSFVYSPVSNLKYIFWYFKGTLRSPRAPWGTPKYLVLEAGKETMRNSQNTWRLARAPWVTPKIPEGWQEHLAKPQKHLKAGKSTLNHFQNTWNWQEHRLPKYLKTVAKKLWVTPKIQEDLQEHRLPKYLKAGKETMSNSKNT